MHEPEFCGRPVKGVVFDLDGTLIHSTVDFRMMKRRMITSLIMRGVPATLVNLDFTVLKNREQAVDYLRSQGRYEEAEEAIEIVGDMMSRTEMERVEGTEAVIGAREVLVRLRSNNLRVGVLTRGSRKYALAALRYANLEGVFDALVCRDDYPEEEAKPNAVAMERMASQLHVLPAECVMVGDHSMDLDCALSSGALFVGVLSGANRAPEWSRGGCPHVIASVQALPDLLWDGKEFE